jgi:hypothetical protein
MLGGSEDRNLLRANRVQSAVSTAIWAQVEARQRRLSPQLREPPCNVAKHVVRSP